MTQDVADEWIEAVDYLEPLTLEVDGIVSTASRMDYHVRPMIELCEDPAVESTYFRQRYDDPPSEEELDAWVRHDRQPF